MANALDFRFLDEGLGGQNKKRKRGEEQQLEEAQDMNVESSGAPEEQGAPARGAGVPEESGVHDDELGAKRMKVADGKAVNAGKVSGRKWKEPRPHRSSTMRTAVSFRRKKTVEERERERALDKAYRARKEELKEEIRASKREKRLKMEEKKRRKEENALKGAVLQKITNPKTLKKMSKKQLKKLVKIPG